MHYVMKIPCLSRLRGRRNGGWQRLQGYGRGIPGKNGSPGLTVRQERVYSAPFG